MTSPSTPNLSNTPITNHLLLTKELEAILNKFQDVPTDSLHLFIKYFQARVFIKGTHKEEIAKELTNHLLKPIQYSKWIVKENSTLIIFNLPYENYQDFMTWHHSEPSTLRKQIVYFNDHHVQINWRGAPDQELWKSDEIATKIKAKLHSSSSNKLNYHLDFLIDKNINIDDLRNVHLERGNIIIRPNKPKITTNPTTSQSNPSAHQPEDLFDDLSQQVKDLDPKEANQAASQQIDASQQAASQQQAAPQQQTTPQKQAATQQQTTPQTQAAPQKQATPQNQAPQQQAPQQQAPQQQAPQQQATPQQQAPQQQAPQQQAASHSTQKSDEPIDDLSQQVWSVKFPPHKPSQRLLLLLKDKDHNQNQDVYQQIISALQTQLKPVYKVEHEIPKGNACWLKKKKYDSNRVCVSYKYNTKVDKLVIVVL
ncbi:hypothetical protein PPL_04592 [Heterostelium album PN500]|uniref:Uncharacterized protein n=1 Tax=Heterostelium pallidum (strain ATCC 26659 / Pp 5 / PN500) TaxID=670386 RepID=D3B804_HETP5|nr:hypothetical protein PPL_04592 [Heterostelium album PN500]EFA82172.1 hypothetical protein PPL_04592 [Heterostelium album PN500]|eukprot:XP_020434289.1 hypothetical protein PPL_04592 [Heterostelium album PN500]